ncbi:MAG: hypothetical protein FJ135_03825 [Deltaproteobacteria bacterium]|nr:hypothetical protein [Deltaproteobacteria bacterium]
MFSGVPKTVSYGLIIGYGALTLAAQIIILREFLTLAQGNELYLGLALWAWLLWTAVGSLTGGRLAVIRPVAKPTLVQLLVVLGICLPLTMLAIRSLPTLMHWPTGLAPTPASLGFWYIVLSGPFGFMSGLFFPLACRWLQEDRSPTGLMGRAYALDALGMSLGGVLLYLLLLGRVDSFWLAAGLGCTVISLLVLALVLRGRRPWILIIVLLALTGSLLFQGDVLSEASRRWQWPQHTVLAVKETPYSVWSATREAEQISFAANGLWFFSWPDPQSAEEQVHYALLQHPRPEKVLLLGGGVAGLAGEILKTPSLTRLDYVELDPRLISMAQRLLPDEALQPYQDQRLRVIYQDGRRFIRQGGSRYDVIIMALPEPRNTLLNRFYTREFFAEVNACLAPRGVFSFGLTGSETALSPVRRSFLALADATLRQVFPEVVVLPGLTWRFFASPEPGSLTADPEILLSRLADRRVELLYVREYYLKANLSPPRRAFARKMLEQAEPELNTDLNPQGLFYGLVLAGMEGNGHFSRWLPWIREMGVGKLYLAAALLTLVVWGWSRSVGLRGRQAPYLYSVFTMGMTVMGLEMVVLILFQISLGYLYGQLGLLLAAFMAGMAVGSWLAGTSLARGAAARSLALGSQGGLTVLLAFLGFGLPWLLNLPYLREDGWGQLIYMSILILGGLLSGVVFAVQGELCQESGAALSLSAGRLYAVDLVGATLGTLGVSLLIIPCFGPGQALLLGAAFNASAVAILLLEGKRRGRPGF